MIALNCKFWKLSVNSLSCSSTHFPLFLPVFPFPLATLLTIVLYSSTLYWVNKIKRNMFAMGYFLREILIHHHWRQKVLLSHWFVVFGGKKISWHHVSCLQIFMSLTHAFDFGRNTTPLSKFIEYIDSTHYCHISPKHSKKNDKEKCREISIFEICVLWRPFTQHASHILSYSNLRCRYLDNQSE